MESEREFEEFEVCMTDLYRVINKPRTDFKKPSMGFRRVYSALQTIFPEVDTRALKAVAIEHSKDVDAAVVAVMEEIIPFFTEKSTPSSPLSQSISLSETSDGETVGLAQLSNVHNVDGGQTPLGDADDGLSEPFYDACARYLEEDVNVAELTLPEKNEDSKMKTSSVDKCPESSIKASSNVHPFYTFEIPQVDTSFSEETNLIKDEEDVDGNSETDLESHPGWSFADGNNLADETALLTSDDETVQPSLKSSQLVEDPDMQESNLDNSNACLSADTASNPENTSNIVGTDDESSNLNATMSRSSQIHTIDVIDEIIADARNNKKTLFSAMENVISLMRQVEDKEKAVELAKVEAASGGMDILKKVQELKQMLEYAKKGNSMDAGDVYGEKAILATELRELHSRVLSLSDERDESLAVLDEMRQTLEVQLAAAENEIKSAEQEKLEKENAAHKLFVDQELVMEKVVQESKNLKQLAQENAKLQEFLTDRGHTVDALQGEIAAICQDVRLLKQKFDLHLPLSESLFPSQTSFVLASSNSSLEKSLVPDQVPMGDDDLFETQKNRDHALVLEEEATEDDRKALENDGWEFYVDAETVV